MIIQSTEKDGIKNWEKFVQDIPHNKSWKIITCGTIPPDPTRILSSNRIKEFLNILNKEEKSLVATFQVGWLKIKK